MNTSPIYRPSAGVPRALTVVIPSTGVIGRIDGALNYADVIPPASFADRTCMYDIFTPASAILLSWLDSTASGLLRSNAGQGGSASETTGIVVPANFFYSQAWTGIAGLRVRTVDGTAKTMYVVITPIAYETPIDTPAPFVDPDEIMNAPR